MAGAHAAAGTLPCFISEPPAPGPAPAGPACHSHSGPGGQEARGPGPRPRRPHGRLGRAHLWRGGPHFASQTSKMKLISLETGWHLWPRLDPHQRCNLSPRGRGFLVRRIVMTATYWTLTALCSLFPLNHTIWQVRSSSPSPEEETEALPEGHPASKWDSSHPH